MFIFFQRIFLAILIPLSPLSISPSLFLTPLNVAHLVPRYLAILSLSSHPGRLAVTVAAPSPAFVLLNGAKRRRIARARRRVWGMPTAPLGRTPENAPAASSSASEAAAASTPAATAMLGARKQSVDTSPSPPAADCLSLAAPGGQAQSMDSPDTVAAPDPRGQVAGTRLSLLWPLHTTLETAAAKHEWFMGLVKQHPGANPVFREGRNVPYITLDSGPLYDQLVTEGFKGEVMVPQEHLPKTVLIHGVPIYVPVNSLTIPPGFMSLRRRFVGHTARPQLIGTVQGNIPEEVWLCGLGRKRVTPYRHEPDLCQRCSRWGHKEWRCRSLPRCRYCAGRHLSEKCRKRIRDGTSFPPCCCNCGGSHNAQSNACPEKPTPFSSLRVQSDPFGRQHATPIVYHPSPPPACNAWENPLSDSNPRQPSADPSCVSSPAPSVHPGNQPVNDPAAELYTTRVLLSIQRELAHISAVLARVTARLDALAPGLVPVPPAPPA